MGSEKLRWGLRAGVYALITLKLLMEEGDMHGYGIRMRIKELSGGALSPSEGTIYEMLKNLRRYGLIEGYWAAGSRGRARKMYRLTEEGRRVLGELVGEARTLRRLLGYVLGVDER